MQNSLYRIKKSTRFKVSLLFFLFILASLLVILIADFTFGLVFLDFSKYDSLFDFFNTKTIKNINAIILIIILYGFSKQHTKLRQGGYMIAVLLRARKVSSKSTDVREKRLFNVVSEMALASKIPIPAIYLLKDETINAFVSGYNVKDAVICVTKGAITHLTREELQGVVAHEFSHIFNDDIRLNMLVSSLLYGLFSLSIAGRRFLDKKIIFAKILGVVLFFFGLLGLFVGSLIKAGISKQKEFLADASGAKFSSSNLGLANALKKVAHYNSYIDSPNSQLYNHFYFANGCESIFSSLFPTHPPIKQRIYALEPEWDGKIQNYSKYKKSEEQQLDLNEKLNMANMLSYEEIVFLNKLPKRLRDLTLQPLGSQAIALALLAHDAKEVSQKSLQMLSSENPKLHSFMLMALDNLLNLNKKDYFKLLLICSSSLKQLTQAEYKHFKVMLKDWIYENEKVVFFEWLIQKIIIKPLDIYFNLALVPIPEYQNLNQTKYQAEFLISFLCDNEYENETEIKNLFSKTIEDLSLQNFNYTKNPNHNLENLNNILKDLILLSTPSKQKLLKICAKNFNSEKNKQIIYAISKEFEIPTPFYS